MKESSLGNSLIDSMGGTVADSMGNILEIGLDSIMEEGLLKDVPFISTAISVFKIGKSIFDRHNIKKLAIFIDEINKKTIDEKKVQQYKEKNSIRLQKKRTRIGIFVSHTCKVYRI